MSAFFQNLTGVPVSAEDYSLVSQLESRWYTASHEQRQSILNELTAIHAKAVESLTKDFGAEYLLGQERD